MNREEYTALSPRLKHDGNVYEATCAFCGNHGKCKEYFKVDLSVEIMTAFELERYGNPFCIDTCYKKIDALMNTKHGSF